MSINFQLQPNGNVFLGEYPNGDRPPQPTLADSINWGDSNLPTGVPAETPENLICVDKNQTSLTMHWKNVGGQPTQTEIRYRDMTLAPDTIGPWQTHGAAVGGQQEYTLTGLSSNRVYEVSARSINAEGTPAWTEPRRQSTLSILPGKPVDVTLMPSPTENNATLAARGFTPMGFDPVLTKRTAAPSDWSAPVAGFYFVHPQHPSATDSNNQYGSLTTPRLTLPSSIQPGEMIYLGPGAVFNGTFSFANYSGGANQPTFITSLFPADPAQFTGGVIRNEGLENCIQEFLKWEGGNTGNGVWGTSYNGGGNTRNVVLRHCTISQIAYIGGGGGVLGISSDDRNSRITENIVIYDVQVRGFVDGLGADPNNKYAQDFWFTSDFDHHQVGITARLNQQGQTQSNQTRFIFVIDCDLLGASGNSVQLVSLGFPATDWREIVHDVYIGRNNTGFCRQPGLWIKRSSFVVMTENAVQGAFFEYFANNGQLAGCQYGGHNLVYINNRMANGNYGIQQTDTGAEASAADYGDLYVIGNIIRDVINQTTSTQVDAWRAGTAVSFTTHGNMNRYVSNNTIIDCVNGVCGSGDGIFDITSNIITLIPGTTGNAAADNGRFIQLGPNSVPGASGSNNLFYRDNGNPELYLGNTTYSDAAAFDAATAFTGSNIADPQFESNSIRPSALSIAVSGGTFVSRSENIIDRLQALFGLRIDRDAYGNALPASDADITIGALEAA